MPTRKDRTEYFRNYYLKHRKQRLRPKVWRRCAECSRAFESYTAKAARYCSTRCRTRVSRRLRRSRVSLGVEGVVASEPVADVCLHVAVI